MTHLFDLSQGPGRRPACGAIAEKPKLLLADEFDALSASEKCPLCDGHMTDYKRWTLHCNICGKAFQDPKSCAEHQLTHTLSRVSYRRDPLAFTVNVQSHYDSPSNCARTLLGALQELRMHFEGFEFTDPIPCRYELQRDKKDGPMLGDGYVAEYIIVQK